jgi:hypothetical protein
MFSKAYSGNTRLLSAWLVLVSTLLVAALFGPALSAGARDTDSAKVLEFDTMAPVSGLFVGPANPIRGFAGGGAPWVIASGSGELSAGGALEVRVRGLVLERTGANPFNQFAVFVSCLTNAAPQQGTPVFAGLFPATPTGDMEAETHITLPRPCVAPIVFVTSPGTSPASARWFAATGVGS